MLLSGGMLAKGLCWRIGVERNFYVFLVLLCLFSWQLTSCIQSSSADDKARLRERSSQLYAKGEYDKAAKEYLALLQLDPSDADAYYHLGLIKAKQAGSGNRQTGVAEFTKAIELNPSHRDARMVLAELYLRADQGSQAKKQVNIVLKHAPRDPEALLLLGRIASREQDTPRAIVAFSQSLDANPSVPEVYRELAAVHERSGDPDAAVAILRKALDRLGPGRGIGQDLADLLARSGKLHEAVLSYRRILEGEPRNEKALLSLADVYKQMRAWNEAEAVYRRLEEAGHAEQAKLLLGDLYRTSGRPAQARLAYEQVLTSHPDSLTARDRLLDLLIETWNIDEAWSRILAIYDKNPKDVMAWYFDGRIKTVRGKLDQAIDLLRAVIRLRPEFSAAHLQLGLALIEKGDQGQALQALTKAVELEPRDAEARIALGRLHLDQESLPLALEQIQAAGHLDPHNPRLALLVADLHFYRKQYDLARERYQALRKLLPTDAAITSRLGRIARAQQDNVRAEALFEEALGLNPHATEPLAQIVDIKLAQNKVVEARDRVMLQVNASSRHPLFHSLLGRLWMLSGESSKAEAALVTAADLINEAGRWASGLGQLYRWYSVAEEEPIKEKRSTIFAAHMALGTINETRADYQGAASRYREVLKLEPRFAPAASRLARILSVHGRDPQSLDTAMTYAQIAREEAPSDPYTADTLGWIYYRKNLRLRALTLLKEAAANLPSDPVVQDHYRLAQAAQTNPKPGMQNAVSRSEDPARAVTQR
jgi:tetratricopeptide (TPR) repeat protein